MVSMMLNILDDLKEQDVLDSLVFMNILDISFFLYMLDGLTHHEVSKRKYCVLKMLSNIS